MTMTGSDSRLRALLRSAVVCTAVLTPAALLPAEAAAQAQKQSVQGVPNAVQGFSQNRDKPIRIDAASLEVRDKDKAATFSGNVKVVQGDTTMFCKVLVVFYDQSQPGDQAAKGAIKAASPGPGGSSSVRRLEAKGGVRVEQKDQVVTGDTGIFDTKTNQVTVIGNVVMTQASSVLRGEKLVVDMTTGISKVDSGGGRGVSALIDTKSGSSASAPAAPLGLGAPKGPAGSNSNASSPREPAAGSSKKPLNLNGLPGGGQR